jgi:hypothetical protein
MRVSGGIMDLITDLTCRFQNIFLDICYISPILTKLPRNTLYVFASMLGTTWPTRSEQSNPTPGHANERLSHVNTSPVGESPRPPSHQKLLSCLDCRQKKVKCDKTYPCKGCQHSGSECVFPLRKRKARKPRSRNAEMILRLGRLEELLEKYEPNNPKTPSSQHVALFKEPIKPSETMIGDTVAQTTKQHLMDHSTIAYQTDLVSVNGSADRFISSEFWSNLGDRVRLIVLTSSQLFSNIDSSDSCSKRTAS